MILYLLQKSAIPGCVPSWTFHVDPSNSDLLYLCEALRNHRPTDFTPMPRAKRKNLPRRRNFPVYKILHYLDSINARYRVNFQDSTSPLPSVSAEIAARHRQQYLEKVKKHTDRIAKEALSAFGKASLGKPRRTRAIDPVEKAKRAETSRRFMNDVYSRARQSAILYLKDLRRVTNRRSSQEIIGHRFARRVSAPRRSLVNTCPGNQSVGPPKTAYPRKAKSWCVRKPG